MEISSGQLTSDFARRHWRDVMDYVEKGGNHVVVSRSQKPIVAIIPFEDYRALAGQLEDMHDLRAVNRNLAEDLASGDADALRQHAARKEENPAWAAEIEAMAARIRETAAIA